MASKNKWVVIILGPTAAGKTAMAINLAKAFGSVILSADSRQIYRRLDIGTAKPTSQQLKDIQHFFIDYKEPWEEFTAGDFEREALDTISSIHAKSDLAFVCGGTGLYIDAICKGIDEMPEVDKNIRASLNERLRDEGIAVLAEELQQLDPAYYAEVDKKNPRRVIRALEVIHSTQQPFSSFRTGKAASRPFKTLKIGLDIDRETLAERIDTRVDQMIENGLLNEVEALLEHKHLNALQTVGYKELFEFLEGKHDLQQAITQIKRNTRRYAKRQMTWFRKDQEIQWFGPGQFDAVRAMVENTIS